MQIAGDRGHRPRQRPESRGRAGRLASPYPRAGGSELRLMLAVALSALGILVWGWCVSRLPHRYDAQIALPLDYLGSEERSLEAMSTEEIWATLLPPPSITEMVRHCPVLAKEVSPEQPEAALRERVSLTVQTLEPGLGQLLVQAQGATRQQARDLALAVGLRLATAAGPNQETQRQTRLLTAAEDRFQRAESEWNATQTELRKLEAEREFARHDESTDQLERITRSMRQAQEQREKIARYLAHPSMNLPTAPALSSQGREVPRTLVAAAMERCRAQRDELAAVFSDQHPAVVHLGRKLARLAADAAGEIVPVSAEMSDAAGMDANASQRTLLEQRLARLDQTIAALDRRQQELARQQTEAKQAFQERLAATRQRAERASRERLFAMHQMTQSSAALRALEQQGPGGERPPFEEPTLTFDGYHRPRWFLGGTAAWFSLVCLLGFLQLRHAPSQD